MGIFKVTRGAGGGREMTQIATPEELEKTGRAPATFDAEDDLLEELGLQKPIGREKKELKKGTIIPDNPSSAYNALLQGVSKHSVAWAKKLIEKLPTIEEVEAIRVKEKNHPKFGGGRVGVLNALEAREQELMPSGVRKDEDGNLTFDCPDCDFTAGSQDGLNAHLAAAHDL